MEEVEKIHFRQAKRTFTKIDHRLGCKACFKELQRIGVIQITPTDTMHFRSHCQIKR